MDIMNIQLKVRHNTDIDRDQLNSIIEPFQDLFNEKVIKDSSCLLSNEDKTRAMIINKSVIELFETDWNSLKSISTVIRNVNVDYTENNKINLRCKFKLGEYQENFDHLFKNTTTGTETELLGYKYALGEDIFYVTLRTNAQRLEVSVSTSNDLGQVNDINTYLDNLELIIKNEIVQVTNDYVGR